MQKTEILHVVGARPNFIKVTPVYRALRENGILNQTIVHTGQHYDFNLSEIFFRDLEIPRPVVDLCVGSGSHAQQTAAIMMRLEPVLLEHRPDLVLVYGDVNSTLAAVLVCAQLQVPVGHVEAGLRSFDRSMPEEINRIVADSLANPLFAPSEDGVANLKREGISEERIFFVGNVMIDSLFRLLSVAVERRCVLPHASDVAQYGVVTLHRPSNVDSDQTLFELVQALQEISVDLPLIFPVHPRTRQHLQRMPVARNSRIFMVDPLGYLDFLALQYRARLVITDSGGIQEETTCLGVPCITVRENTERPVTVSLGTNILVGRDWNRLKQEVRSILAGKSRKGALPPLWDGHAGQRIAEIIASNCLRAGAVATQVACATR